MFFLNLKKKHKIRILEHCIIVTTTISTSANLPELFIIY